MTLDEFFLHNPHVALAFSGGVDSSVLLAYALEHGVDILPIFARSPLISQEDWLAAQKVAQHLGIHLSVIDIELLGDPQICENNARRCYFCKTRIFSAMRTVSQTFGYPCLIDGSNASDQYGERPGMQALEELGIRSPLREAGLTKKDIRLMAKNMHLPNWDAPASPCLATRIAFGEHISLQKLARIASAEKILRDMGFINFRVRMSQEDARIEIMESQLSLLVSRRPDILGGMEPLFRYVTLNLKMRDEYL